MLKYLSDDSSTESNQSDKAEYEEDDLTAKVVGHFGRWQLMISVAMALLKLPMAWYQLSIIFLAPPQEFWCVKPESLTQYSEKEWRQICTPHIEEHPCLIFDPDILSIGPSVEKTLIPLVPCTNFTYDKSVFNRTITSDWDLVCTRHWLIHLSQCVMMWGVMIGGIIFGVLADKHGRRKPLLFTVILQSISGYAASTMPGYWSFLFMWFILALASGGIGIISFVLCMEVVSGKWRTTVSILYQLPFGIGSAVMAGLAYWLRDWRKLEFALSTISSLFIIYALYIPESPRWLLATGQTDKALDVLHKAAIQNNRKYNLDDIKSLLPRNTSTSKAKDPGFKTFLKMKNMRMKTILLSINWFCMGIAYYTFAQNLGSIGANIFLTVAATGIISTPGALICVFVVNKFSRKTTIWTFQFITALCFIFILIIPKDRYANDWPRLLFTSVGFAGMAGSVPSMYLFTGELYPTVGRNVGVGGVTTFARIGSMIAPGVASLDDMIPNTSLILLAATSFAQMLLLLPLPETKGQPLPDSLEQAEQFTKEATKTKKGRS